jgi:hypothetical protein
MAETPQNEADWDPGFDGGRQVVVSRLGPWRRVFARPERYRKWFFHTLYDLPLDEWEMTAPPRSLAGVCRVQTALFIRFQPAVRYLAANIDCLVDPYAHVRQRFRAVMVDQAEQALKDLARGDWLEEGLTPTERAVEEAVNVTLALNDIHARCRCEIEVEFLADGQQPPSPVMKDAGFYDKYPELMRGRIAQEQQDMQERMGQLDEKRRQHLAYRERQLELERQTLELEQRAERETLTEMKGKLHLAEEEQRLQRESELRRHQEQLQQEAELQRQSREAELAMEQQRLQSLDARETHARRELDVLFMEKQRLLLQEEIRGLRNQIGEK